MEIRKLELTQENFLKSLPMDELLSLASWAECEVKWREANGREICPECGARLTECGGIDRDGEVYDGIACMNGCNLWGYFGT